MSWNSGVDSGDLEQHAEDLVADLSGSFEGASSGRSKMQQQDALAIAQNGGNDLLEDDIDPVTVVSMEDIPDAKTRMRCVRRHLTLAGAISIDRSMIILRAFES